MSKKQILIFLFFGLIFINSFSFHIVEKRKMYRSGQLSPKNFKKYINKYSIKSVINLRGTNKNKKWWQKEKQVTQELNIHFYNIPMRAKTLPSKQNIIKLLKIYSSAPCPILIHCKSGADRTGEAAAIYKLDQMETSKQEALKQLSLKYGHFAFIRRAKRFFIKLWQGRDWALNKYNPKMYPKFN